MAVARPRRPLGHLRLSVDVGTLAVPRCGLSRLPCHAAAAAASSSTSTCAEFSLQDFDKIAELGRGNGGTVCKVRHRGSSSLYALKTLHCSEDSSPAAAAEAEILRGADSPFIVRCHSVLPAASGDLAFLLELMDGGSLSDLLRRRRSFSEPALAEVAAQALAGLAHLHSRRIVHLDIKPGNLLASSSGSVKIADFGIAKILCRGDEVCTSSEGTAAYMSPERFDLESHGGCFDPYAADVWSLGVTVMELFLGYYPLLPAGRRPEWAELMCAICFREAPSLQGSAASDELRGFVAACLQKDCKKRASVAELLAHPFIARRDAAKCRGALRELIAEANA